MQPGRTEISAAALVACALVLAACGATAKKPAGHHGGSRFMGYSVCMRAHGVPNFPDPAGNGGIRLPDSFDVTAPSFRSAHKTCQHKLPGGGPGNFKPSRQALAAAVKTAECMRAHGVSGFPDPYVSLSLPALNPAQYSVVQDRGGIVIAIPKTIDVTSPAFQNASKACGFR